MSLTCPCPNFLRNAGSACPYRIVSVSVLLCFHTYGKDGYIVQTLIATATIKPSPILQMDITTWLIERRLST